MGRTFLTPHDVVTIAKTEGVTITEPTLATWRNRCPDRIPFERIAGRIYYRRDAVERFLKVSLPEPNRL